MAPHYHCGSSTTFRNSIYTSFTCYAKSLATSETLVEFTLTIFLIGFAFGTLLWGKLSDKYGRRPCLMLGITFYIIGCIICWFSHDIYLLLLGRFIQAFGGSTGSVLGQAICRDAFHGPERGKVYSTIGGALAFSPAVGPVVGGIIAQYFGWRPIFLVLTCIGLIVLFFVHHALPETHDITTRSTTKMSTVLFQLMCDMRVLGFTILVAAANGIQFSYYAEGSFYLIELLGVSPTWYGLSFIGIACAGMIGSWISKWLHNTLSSEAILQRGIFTICYGSSLFALATFFASLLTTNPYIYISITMLSMMYIMVGIGIMIPNALALALEDYKHSIGTAASLFGFAYYALIALFTAIMGLLHNHTYLPMPLFFWALSMLMLMALYILIKKHTK